MHILRNAVIAGIASIAIGASGTALAQSPNVHVMNVRVPDGGTAQIRYTGNVPPQISFSEAPGMLAGFAPMPSLFGAASPFAAMERLSAEMDRRAAAMFRQADAMLARADAGQPVGAAVENLPAGSRSYSFVSTMSGSGVCAQSVEITATGNGPPRIVRRTSGDCGPAAGSAGGVTVPAFTAPRSEPRIIETNARPAKPYRVPAATGRQPDLILTGAKGAKPYAGLVREIPAAGR